MEVPLGLIDVRKLEHERYEAMRSADTRTLDILLSDDLIYGHANGSQDGKKSLLARIVARDVVFESLDHTQDKVIARPGITIVSGTIRGQAHFAGKPLTLDNRTLTVWMTEGERWVCVAYQPTPFNLF